MQLFIRMICLSKKNCFVFNCCIHLLQTSKRKIIEIHQSQNVCACLCLCVCVHKTAFVSLTVFRIHSIRIGPMNQTTKNKLIQMKYCDSKFFSAAFLLREIAVILSSQFNGLELVWREVLFSPHIWRFHWKSFDFLQFKSEYHCYYYRYCVLSTPYNKFDKIAIKWGIFLRLTFNLPMYYDK